MSPQEGSRKKTTFVKVMLMSSSRLSGFSE